MPGKDSALLRINRAIGLATAPKTARLVYARPLCYHTRHHGEMSERLKEHDWKSCVLAKTGTEGSNPSLSASLILDFTQFYLRLFCSFFHS